jgi:NADH dehydrogenase FAD-containing subunit
LYQVATSVLSSGQIASPIRGLLSKQRNTTGILGEVSGVDTDRRCVFVDSPDRDGVALEYDYLILATGASHSYFGHDEFARFAPGLKTLADAVSIRNRILRAFEQAEARQGQHGSARQGLRGAAERPAASRRLSRLESVVDMNALRRRPPRPWDTGHAARRQKSLATVEGS